jgi:hypothetical protein
VKNIRYPVFACSLILSLILLGSLSYSAGPQKPMTPQSGNNTTVSPINPSTTPQAVPHVQQPTIQSVPKKWTVAPADIKILGSLIARGESSDILLEKWKAMLVGANDQTSSTDINSVVQQVIREAYLQQTEDLKQYSEKVKYFNEIKKQIRDEQNRVLKADMSPGSAPLCKMEIVMGKGIMPSIVFPQNACLVSTEQQRQDYIRYLADKLNDVGDDSQLANVDLQDKLQKQQQTLQMLSAISKLLNDTAMNVIRKIGG